MAKSVVLDELHLTCRIPADLPDETAEAARRALATRSFTARLRRAVRAALREVPDLAPVRVTLSR